MNQYESHVSYVTREVHNWLDNEHRTFVDEKLRYIREQNAEALRDYPDSMADHDEDIEYLAGELEAFAVSELVSPYSGTITAHLMSDALSEADWADIALEYLP